MKYQNVKLGNGETIRVSVYTTEEHIQYFLPNDYPWKVEVTEHYANQNDLPITAMAMDMQENLVFSIDD